jgi:hypothetical protein
MALHSLASGVFSRRRELFGQGEPVIFLLPLAAFAAKVGLMMPAATDSFLIAVVQHDAVIFATMLALYVAGSARSRLDGFRGWRARGLTIASFSARLACLVLVGLYAADVFAYYFFGTRLYASDLVTFSSEMDSVGTLVGSAWHIMTTRRGYMLVVLAALAAAVVLWACIVFVVRPSTVAVGRRRALTASAALLALYLIPLPSYVYAFGDKPLFENFVERNRSYFVQTNFSDDFREQVLSFPPEKVCRAGASLKLNVILVMVESLSAYHSHAFSGIEDWTPRLDEIASRATALPNFHANGWTTIGGLISLLGGSFPLVPEAGEDNEWGSPRLSNFMHLSDTLPQVLAREGYRTIFAGAGDLSFLDQRDWLRAVGFQRVVGEEDPRFDRQQVRGAFKSVPDQLLYEIVLDEIDRQPTGAPYFITAQTFWSHRPFMAPDGSELSGEEPVIRMTDESLGFLYDRLMERGFFEDGILFVTGDHRAMEPYRRSEIERYGASAATRIPAIVVTHAVELPPVIEDHHQQRDLKVSVEALVRQRYCADRYEGTFLGPSPTPPACVMQAKGDDRDLIFVGCAESHAVVRIAGDDTRVVQGSVDDEAGLLRAINYTRVRRTSQPSGSPEEERGVPPEEMSLSSRVRTQDQTETSRQHGEAFGRF